MYNEFNTTFSKYKFIQVKKLYGVLDCRIKHEVRSHTSECINLLYERTLYYYYYNFPGLYLKKNWREPATVEYTWNYNLYFVEYFNIFLYLSFSNQILFLFFFVHGISSVIHWQMKLIKYHSSHSNTWALLYTYGRCEFEFTRHCIWDLIILNVNQRGRS